MKIESPTQIDKDDLKPAKLVLKAMNKYGAGNGAIILAVLDEMKPFDSPSFNETNFWQKVEQKMETINNTFAKKNIRKLEMRVK